MRGLYDAREGAEHPAAEFIADPIVHSVADDGGDEDDEAREPDVEAGYGVGCNGADSKEQRVAGQEWGDDEAGFAEDDQEKQAIDQWAIGTGECGEVLLDVEDEVDGFFHVFSWFRVVDRG